MIASVVQLLGLVILAAAGALVSPALGVAVAGVIVFVVGVSMEGDR